MESINAVNSIKTIQGALRVLTALQLTGYMWPQQAHVQDGASFDYIVVGAGTAGCVVANRLTEDNNTKVLLIEAGGDPPLEAVYPGLLLLMKRSHSDWNYTAENDKYTGQCHQNPHFEMTLGKVLGGTSSANYLIYERGNPHGYKSWAAAAKDDTWKWENVLPYFMKLERVEDPDILSSPEKAFYGTEGFLGMTQDHGETGKYLDAYKELGHAIGYINGTQSLGYSRMMLTMSQGARQSSAQSYLSPIKNRPNLYVLKNTLVTKILFDENKNAVGVNAVTEDGKSITLKATKEVIVSTGVFNTPKLLMLSGIGPKEHLQSMNIDTISDLPVGNNLIDYISTTVCINMEKLQKPLPPRDPHEYPPDGIIGFVSMNKSQEYPDYQVLGYITEAPNALLFYSFFFRYTHEISSNVFKFGAGRMQLHNQIVNLNPKSRGKVLLRSSDPADAPLIHTDYFSVDEDMDNLIDYIMDYVPVMNTTYFKSNDAEIFDAVQEKCSTHNHGSKEYWRCYTTCMMSGMSNFMGTCAMGSVVDGRLRVYGVQRLRVADASIMPTPNGGNPYGQVVMIGEKVADFIKEEHNS